MSEDQQYCSKCGAPLSRKGEMVSCPIYIPPTPPVAYGLVQEIRRAQHHTPLSDMLNLVTETVAMSLILPIEHLVDAIAEVVILAMSNTPNSTTQDSITQQSDND